MRLFRISITTAMRSLPNRLWRSGDWLPRPRWKRERKKQVSMVFRHYLFVGRSKPGSLRSMRTKGERETFSLPSILRWELMWRVRCGAAAPASRLRMLSSWMNGRQGYPRPGRILNGISELPAGQRPCFMRGDGSCRPSRSTRIWATLIRRSFL